VERFEAEYVSARELAARGRMGVRLASSLLAERGVAKVVAGRKDVQAVFPRDAALLAMRLN
jgi:hypothetical protein